MPTPEYILTLREKIGHDYLWLSGATAVIRRDSDHRVLLVRRSDNGAWTPVTGIVDPGACARAAQSRPRYAVR